MPKKKKIIDKQRIKCKEKKAAALVEEFCINGQSMDCPFF